MKKIIGIAFLADGIIALVYGFQAKGSLESKLTETFTGSPSRNARWLLIGGAAAAAAGVGLILFRKD